MSESIARREADVSAQDKSSRSTRYLTIAGVSLAFSIIGFGIAGYLTFTHFQEEALICTVGGCETVQESEYATIGAVPIAALGLGMFIVLGGLALTRIQNWSTFRSDTLNIAAWGITLTAIMYYAYLTYVEVFVLEAICQWCVGTALATLAIFAAESVGVWREFSFDEDAALE